MTFDVSAESYGLFMGRFSDPLAPEFADFAGVSAGSTALDVGCGTGALTAVLAQRLGADKVSGADPSTSFVEATRARLPGVVVRQGRAENLPFGTDAFDLVLAQLVVHFMTDPVGGIREMARVARPGGTVAAAVWDHGGSNGPLAVFWAAARAVTPDVADESHLPGVRDGHLAALFAEAGLVGRVSTALSVEVAHESFAQWWHPFTLGVGPAGAHIARLTDAERAAVREKCRAMLPDGSFTTKAVAWAVKAHVSR